MPRYVKDGRIIFASNKAYEILLQRPDIYPMKKKKRHRKQENKLERKKTEKNRKGEIPERV